MVDSNLTARAPLALPQQLVWAVLDESRVVFDAARSLLLHVVVCRDVSHLPEHQLRGTPRGSGVKPRGGGSSSWAWGSPPPSRPPPPPHCRRTAAAPPHCWGASCAVPFFSLCILDEILVVPSHEIVGQVSINPNSRSRAPLPSFSCWADQDPSRGCSRRENPIPRAHSASWQLDSHPDFCAPFRRDAFKALDIFVAWDPCRAPG